MSKPKSVSNQTTSNPNQTPSKREEIAKKISDLRKTVATPVLGNHVEIPVDQILDIQVVTTNNNKLKMKIVFGDESGVNYAVIGMLYAKTIEECVKDPNVKAIVIDRYENLRTEVKCL